MIYPKDFEIFAISMFIYVVFVIIQPVSQYQEDQSKQVEAAQGEPMALKLVTNQTS